MQPDIPLLQQTILFSGIEAEELQHLLTAHSVEPPQALRQPVFCPEAGVCSLRRRRQAAYLLCAPAQGGSIFHGDLLSVEHFA